ncbi:hypothetical protein GQ651_12570 [Alphaproteobacteria bacterium GH1-50]|uniref:Uncharacterized protein n=1 Tax=Kangsaoukella pontilimi TaxID=2691042 RepID=A0A7C9IJ66_9RHOB|nr:hypothetical protein [Kangsaoukella pontilimi]MXQ08682.1 hypothetical protein [Kangsaoukella pontilimi]
MNAELKPRALDIEFFSKESSKTTQLVNNADVSAQIDGKHTWFKYIFNEPVFLTKIEVFSEGYNSWDKFEIIVTHVDGTFHEESVDVKTGVVSLQLGKLVSGFQFRPGRKWSSSPKITKVIATGLTLSEFHAFEWKLKEHEQRAAELAEKQSNYDALKDTRDTLSSEKTQLESEIGKSRSQLDDLNTKVSSASNSLETLLEDVKTARSDVKRAREDKNKLLDETAEIRRELETLTREVRLFPSEISGFVREGNRNIRWYIGLSMPFVIVLFVILNSLFSSAIDLTQLWRNEESIDVWTIFLTRLPFVLVAFALIEACGYIVGRLIYEIVRINRQRLEFAKLSIVAKDVSAASANTTSLTDDEVFEKETQLKMNLLREHMKNQSADQFEYKGSAIVSALVGVAERLGGKKGD